MGSRLSDRLKRIKGAQRSSGAPRILKGDDPIPGWESAAPCLYYRKEIHPLEFPGKFDPAPFLLRRIQAGRSIAPESSLLPREKLSFVDIETTGLSTGAGTRAFAFGHGSFGEGGFVLEQWFLSDIPGEEAFLDAISSRIGAERVMVSYNGMSFDTNVLRSRFILSGRRFPEPAQMDLLFTARRLWSVPAGGASLSRMEAFVLGSPRIGDIDGSEAPERYIDWLHGAPFSRIEPILLHHGRDILSLPHILLAADGVFREPLGPGVDRDWRRLGLILAALGRTGWEECLSRARAEDDSRAGCALALLYSRRGRKDDALKAWLSMEDEPRALREAAKILEHHAKDFRGALALVEKALSRSLSADDARDFEKRRIRLLSRSRQTPE